MEHPLGMLLELSRNIRVDLKGLPMRNTLAYLISGYDRQKVKKSTIVELPLGQAPGLTRWH